MPQSEIREDAPIAATRSCGRAKRSWAGVDVGGPKKGFDLAVIDAERLVAGPTRIRDRRGAVRWLREHSPAVVAVDSPIRPAPYPALSRDGERALVRARVCGIRYTPNAARLT